MSLSADERKAYWQGHKDGLNRIRSQLSTTPPVRSPVRSPAGYGGHRSHSPLGKYRKASSPSVLPRLESPEDHPGSPRLRGSKFSVVPPVHRKSRHGTPDYDSWGEESDEDEDDRNPATYYMPQPYPMPAYGYQPQEGAPPPVVFGFPFPAYYPPPPTYKGKGKKGKRGRADRMEVHASQPEQGRKPKKNYPVTFSLPNHYQRSERRPYDPDRNDMLRKYRYIYPRDSITPYSPVQDDHVTQRYKDDPESLAYFYFKDHPLFAERTAQWLINDILEELIPDVIIDSLDTFNDMDPSHPYYYPSSRVRDDVLNEIVDEMGQDVVRSAAGDLVNDYFGYTHPGQDPLEGFLDRLMNDAVRDSARDIVVETVKEMASDHMRTASAVHIFDDIMEEYIEEIQRDLVDDIVQDLLIEELIEELIIEPEIEDEAPEIAREVLNKYDNKIEKRELKEVSKQAGEKLMESIMQTYLLSLISRQGKVWNESDHANKYMDDMILGLLMEQYNHVNNSRDKTLTNKPLKKLHEKAITDVGLDLLLQEMSASLDEDMADVDEYERGVENLNSAPPTPYLLALNVKDKR